ncbi:hypothetical protein H920_10641 [Fukomys damarensis]|uniref:Uncharacterized protein n=1 Tax=Fukomys damarensis TaxID=885580 RepID=A0A091DCF8_FUKDA|nr:hypothetical protein H920_10641 [Fukomys damarensis]
MELARLPDYIIVMAFFKLSSHRTEIRDQSMSHPRSETRACRTLEPDIGNSTPDRHDGPGRIIMNLRTDYELGRNYVNISI